MVLVTGTAALMPADGVGVMPVSRVEAVRPVAATYALVASAAGFTGDSPSIPQDDAVEAAQDGADRVLAAGTLAFGQPVRVPDRASPQTATTTERNVNLRRGPGTRYHVVTRLARGTRLRVLGLQPGWYRVAAPGGTLGWVAAAYLRLAPAPDQATASPAPGDAVPEIALEADGPPQTAQPLNGAAGLAKRHVGAPYVWGGESPDGFDCSGLTKYVYARLGVSLPHKASLQYSARYGTRIGRLDDLQPGDLVFFVRTTRARGITHVGVYTGNGLMVTANTSRTGVQEVSVYGSYWQTRFAGGIRPFR